MYQQSEQQYLLHVSSQYDELWPTNGWDWLVSLGQISTGFVSWLHFCTSVTQWRLTNGRLAIPLGAGPHSSFLWSPYVIGQTIIFLPCGFYLLPFFFFSAPNLSGWRLDVYHTFTHGVALVRI